jgi:uncharacterized protein DUF3179
MKQTMPLPDRRSVELFDRAAYDRFKLPRRMGEAIAAWDAPEYVPGVKATHMREDDYVIGIVHRGLARAYPLWIIDNYHVINDRFGDDRVVVTSCERCQSGSAFVAQVPGNPEREPLFRTVGFLNAVLLMKDLRTGSFWCHYDGRGLNRQAAGVSLPWIPSYHMEWTDWRDLHPDTEVMVPPVDPRHPDARHGHGREEFFARPGMDPAFLPTVVGDYDTSYPENELVLGIDDVRPAAFPLQEVRRAGGVVHDRSPSGEIVVFAGPRIDGFTMAAFRPKVGDRHLRFVREDGAFRDAETGSRWTIEGRAFEGSLAGAQLKPIRSFCVRWHAWIYQRRDTRLYRSARELERPSEATPEQVGGFGPFLAALDRLGYLVEVEGPVISQQRPRRSEASVTVRIDGNRLNLHRFTSVSAATDFDALAGAWSGLPIKTRSREGRTRRMGRIVVESDPEVRYEDPANVVPRPDGAIDWSPLLSSPDLDHAVGVLDEGSGSMDGVGVPDAADARQAGFLEVIRGLRLSGLEVLYEAYLPPSQLRVGCEDGIALSIDGDWFLLYRFSSPEAAAAYGSSEPHSMAAGSLVLRSAPSDMYVFPGEVLYAGDDRIRWSELISDRAFKNAFQRYAEEPARLDRSVQMKFGRE